jgi:hypothetical protein
MSLLHAAVLLMVFVLPRANEERSVASGGGQQPSLASVAATAAGYWSQRDADGLARVLSPGGVALHLLDESHPAAGVSQARTALSDLLGRGGRAQVTRAEQLVGSPPRGFAELGWEVMAPGSPAALRYVILLGFVLEDDAWRISEIRVLR